MIKTIIFDMDGILIDLKEMHRNAFLKSLKSVYFMELTEDYHDKNLCGYPTKIKLEMLNVPKNDSIRIEKLKQEITLQEIEKIKEDEDLQEILNILSYDYYLFCASNSLNKTVELVLDKLGILHFFEKYFGNNDVLHSKPSPEMYNRCMIESRSLQCETLAIEDSKVGEETIKNARVHGLIVKNRQDLILSKILNKIKEI